MSKKKVVTRKSKSTQADEPELSFEDALEQLETLIDRVESGEAGLEESIADYERGNALIRRCRSVLDAAEQRITELTAADFNRADDASAGVSGGGSGESCGETSGADDE